MSKTRLVILKAKKLQEIKEISNFAENFSQFAEQADREVRELLMIEQECYSEADFEKKTLELWTTYEDTNF